jgi:streptomycin 6-kinase
LRRPGAAEWAAGLPDTVGRCADRWSLQLGAALPGATTSFVAAAARPGGRRAVLKIPFLDRESEHEAAALAAWGGRGAVRLLEHDPVSGAMLLERCEPGSPLAAAGPDRALDVLAGLLPRLWRPAGTPFRSLAGEARRWAEALPRTWEEADRPFERRLVDAAVEALHALVAAPAGPAVLLHQDLHGGNVLAATREPWLVIDPKPLAGEREFGPAPIVRSAELGRGERAMRRRLDRLTAELGLDRERCRAWTLAQTLAWAFEGGRALPGHVEAARWLLGG